MYINLLSLEKSVRPRTKNKIQTKQKQTGENKQKFNHRYDVYRNITDHFILNCVFIIINITYYIFLL